MKRGLTFLVGLLFYWGLSACQQTDPQRTLPSAIYIPRESRDQDVPNVDETLFAEAYEAAQDCRGRSEIERALKIIQDTLQLGAPRDWHGRFIRLEGELKRESVQRTILDAFVLLSRERFSLGEMIEGEIVIQNISGQTVVIPATRSTSIVGQTSSAEAKSVLHATVAFTEYRPFDMVIRNSQDRMIIIDNDINLKPGGVFRVPISIDSRALDPSSPTYRTYELGGTLHPTIVKVGEATFTSRIALRPVTAHVFPRNYEHLAEAPLERLKDALRRSALTHLPIVAALLRKDDANEARSLLFAAMNEVGCAEPLRQTIITCLRIITGERFGGTPTEWNNWYRTLDKKESS